MRSRNLNLTVVTIEHSISRRDKLKFNCICIYIYIHIYLQEKKPSIFHYFIHTTFQKLLSSDYWKRIFIQE